MASKELVKKAIKFQSPSRIPYNFDANRTPDNGKKYGEDFLWVFVKGKEKIKTIDGEIDEWGCLWQTLSDSFGEPKTFPLEGKENLDGFTMPDFTEDWRYEEMKEKIINNKNDKYVLGMLPHGLFQKMLELFGFMDFMLSVGGNIEIIEELCDILCESAMKVIEKMVDCGVDGVILIDDMALQDRLMISMDVFIDVFKPRYKKLFDLCHQRGIDTFIHACGNTYDIIEELIDAGLDVINLDQQDNMGIEYLSKRYKGRICFYCPIDIQTTVNMLENEIRERVRQMVNAFASKEGGFIAKTYPQPTAINMSDEYLKIMTDEFKASSTSF